MQRGDEKKPTASTPPTPNAVDARGRARDPNRIEPPPRPPPRPDEERVWLAFAQSAVSGFTSIDGFTDNMGLSIDAARIADAMVVQWRRRFDPPAPTPTSTDEPTF